MVLYTEIATLNTTKGTIVLHLFGHQAPKTVKNFIDLATGAREWTHPKTTETTQNPLYDGVIFHRVIPGFMIQTGDPLGTGTGGPGYRFDDEINSEVNFNEPYMLAMANAGMQAGKGTNGSQFFITVDATSWLQGKHTIFGCVADEDSRKVVDAIASVATNMQDRPVEDIVIRSITVESA